MGAKFFASLRAWRETYKVPPLIPPAFLLGTPCMYRALICHIHSLHDSLLPMEKSVSTAAPDCGEECVCLFAQGSIVGSVFRT